MRKTSQKTLANLARSPVRLLPFGGNDGRLYLLRQLVGISKRPATAITQSFPPTFLITPSISPDASRIAVTKADPITGGYDIWIEDLKQKHLSRLTFQRGLNYYPLWTPKGEKPAAGNSDSEQILRNHGGNEYAYDVSADGKLLLFVQIGDVDRGGYLDTAAETP